MNEGCNHTGALARRVPAPFTPAVALGLFILGCIATPATAQDPTPTAPGPLLPSSVVLPPCIVVKQAIKADAQPSVVAVCRGHGFVLGPSTDYQVYRNDSLQATIVDLHNGPTRRVLLISFPEQNQPLLEDIGGELAISAGRGPTSPLTDIAIDFSGFASDGHLSVHSMRSNETSSLTPAVIQVANQIAEERARRAATGGK